MRGITHHRYIGIISMFALPSFVFAAASIQSLLNLFMGIVQALIPIVFALALLFFFFELAMFILHAGDATGNEKGKNLMLWGIISLFVMSSIWGLVGILQKSFQVDNSNAPNRPSIIITR